MASGAPAFSECETVIQNKCGAMQLTVWHIKWIRHFEIHNTGGHFDRLPARRNHDSVSNVFWVAHGQEVAEELHNAGEWSRGASVMGKLYLLVDPAAFLGLLVEHALLDHEGRNKILLCLVHLRIRSAHLGGHAALARQITAHRLVHRIE